MDRKLLIINAALKLFVANGFHGTATSKIAQEAGVANGTLFQYFKTKDDLIIYLYIHIKDELAGYIASNTPKGTDLKKAFKSQVLSSLYWALDNPVKFRFIQQFQTSPYIGQVEQEVINKQAELHFKLIEKGIKQGVLKPLPVELMYSLISSQVFGLYYYLETNNFSKDKRKDVIQTAFKMLWKMIT